MRLLARLRGSCRRSKVRGDASAGSPGATFVTDSNLSPMMAVRWPAAFSDPDWYFEPKCDGYRVIASTDGTVHRLRSRSGLDFADTYPDIGNPCRVPVVIDGEIVTLDGSS